MKALRYFLYSIVLAGLLSSCQEDKLDLYTAANSIYFEGRTTDGEFLPVDSSYFSFGYVGGHIQDSLYQIVIRATGPKMDYDRPYNLITMPNSSLTEEVDYTWLDKDFSIKAHQLSDTIKIKLLRSQGIKEEILKLDMELRSNENFATEMTSTGVGSGANQQTRYYTKHTLSVDDIIGTPWFWDLARNSSASIFIGYLGEFSARKFQIMIGRFNLDVDVVTAEGYRPAVTALLGWAYSMQSYLNEMAANGAPILEDNGTPMVMGPYAQ